MLKNIFGVFEKIERVLRIDDQLSAGDLLRARAVYLIGIGIILLEVLELLVMLLRHGDWQLANTCAAGAIVLLTALVIQLRYTKNFSYFAGAFSFLLLSYGMAVSTPLLTSHANQLGVNSPYLYMLVSGAILNAFVSGWRAVLKYSLVASGAIWVLLYISFQAPYPSDIDRAVYEGQLIDPTLYLQFFLLMMAGLCAYISYKVFEAFEMLETNIQEVKTLEEIKSQFLANMSHELRTPLNGVIGMSGLLMRTKLDPTQTQYADIIHSSSEGLVSIINDVLDLSKLDAGKIALQSEPLNLLTLLTKLQTLHMPNAHSKGIQLLLDYDPHIPVDFVGDEGRLRQITNNLIGNAIKFTSQGFVRVSVRAEALKDGRVKVHIYVADTGKGIPQKDLGRVFERFEQVTDKTGDHGKGTGLGLSIVKEMIEAMGGNISIQSEVGRGTMFNFSVALNQTIPKQAQQDISTEEPSPRKAHA